MHHAAGLGFALIAVMLSAACAALAQTAPTDTGPTGIDIIPTDLPAHASSIQKQNGPISLLPGTIPTETRIETEVEIPSLADQYQRAITGQAPLPVARQQVPKTLVPPAATPFTQPPNLPKATPPTTTVQNKNLSTLMDTVAPAAAPTSNSRFLIQLGAFRDTFSAETYWASFLIRYPELSKSYEKKIVKADLGSQGIYHRLQLVGFKDADSAREQCRQLKADGTDCFATGNRH